MTRRPPCCTPPLAYERPRVARVQWEVRQRDTWLRLGQRTHENIAKNHGTKNRPKKINKQQKNPRPRTPRVLKSPRARRHTQAEHRPHSNGSARGPRPSGVGPGHTRHGPAISTRPEPRTPNPHHRARRVHATRRGGHGTRGRGAGGGWLAEAPRGPSCRHHHAQRHSRGARGGGLALAHFPIPFTWHGSSLALSLSPRVARACRRHARIAAKRARPERDPSPRVVVHGRFLFVCGGGNCGVL